AREGVVAYPRQSGVVGPVGLAGDEAGVFLALAGVAYLVQDGFCGHVVTPALPAAFRTALTMFWYPVQRHRLPSSPSLTSSSVGCGLSRNRSAAAMIMPGVQYPHCSACSSWNAC